MILYTNITQRGEKAIAYGAKLAQNVEAQQATNTQPPETATLPKEADNGNNATLPDGQPAAKGSVSGLVVGCEIPKQPEILAFSELPKLLEKETNAPTFKELAFPEIKQYQEELNQLAAKEKELAKEKEKLPILDQVRVKELLKLIKAADKADYADKALAVKEFIDSFAQKHGVKIAFDSFEKCYYFNKHIWREIEEDELYGKGGILPLAAAKIGIPHNEQFKAPCRNAYLEAIKKPATFKQKDLSTVINLANCALEISVTETNGQKSVSISPREYRAADYLTYKLGFDFDPSAKAEKFNAFLRHNIVLPNMEPDLDSVEMFYQFMGYVFIRHASEFLPLEKCLILSGSGSNGKTVLQKVLTAFYGEKNTTHYAAPQITDERGYYLAKMVGKVLNYAGEMGHIKDIDIFKNIISGGFATVRNPGGEPKNTNNYPKLIFNTNGITANIEQNEAFRRRLLIIHFIRTIEEGQRNPNLAGDIIKTELPGIMNEALLALGRLIQAGKFTESENSRRAVKTLMDENNPALIFMQTQYPGIAPGNACYVEAARLYENYRAFSGNKPELGRNDFNKALKAIGYEIKERRENKNKLCAGLNDVTHYSDLA